MAKDDTVTENDYVQITDWNLQTENKNDFLTFPKSEDVIVASSVCPEMTSSVCPEITSSYSHGRCSQGVEKIELWFHEMWQKKKKKVFLFSKIVSCLLYLIYFGYCVYYRYFDEGSYILTALTGFWSIKLCYSSCSGRSCKVFGQTLYKCYVLSEKTRKVWSFFKYLMYIAVTVLLCVYLGVSVISQNPQNAQAVLGLVFLVFFCFLFSASPSKVNWHPVYWGFVIQFCFAILSLRTTIGYETFKWMGDLVHKFVRLSDQGSAFVLGDSFRAAKAGFFFECAGVIVFFNSCMFILDYYGVLEFIVLKLGRGLSICLKTGPVESIVSAANIFIGLSEAPLLVRPYLPTVTKSELHAIMTCGFSSISGAFMAMFIKSGAPPNHLLTAAVISAPAALAISKLMYPEMDKVNLDSQQNVKMRDENSPKNLLQAASDGANMSIKLVASIMVNMMAFVSLLNLINVTFVWFGERAGVQGMTFDLMCSYILYPLAYIMGASPEDCTKVGALIGLKFFATPFVAYAELGKIIQNRQILDNYLSQYNGTWYTQGDDVILTEANTTLYKGVMTERSVVVTTYALCGISAFPAIGFCLGTLLPMCPSRKKDVISLVLRAFIAGNLTNYITGAVADEEYHMGGAMDEYHMRDVIDEYHMRGAIDEYHRRGAIDEYHRRGAIDEYH
ncbi:hypothetical protein Btru_027195 [Bulinus truncatus]|nr:hypothetical protein Btru_027195 [Bulinus truncatus]